MSKKIIYLLSLLMALSLVFASCKKNSVTDALGGQDQPPTTGENDGGSQDNGLYPDSGSMPNDDEFIRRSKLFNGEVSGNYHRNPVIVAGRDGVVFIFAEKRWERAGGANDIGIDGQGRVDVVYLTSTTSGKDNFNNSTLATVGQAAKDPKDSHGAPIVYYIKGSNNDATEDKIVVVASAGSGFGRTTKAILDSIPSRVDYIVGTFSDKSTINWGAWKTIESPVLSTKVAQIKAGSTYGDYTMQQFGTHSHRGVITTGNKLILPLVVAQQGTTDPGPENELMGVYVLEGTVGSDNVTWSDLNVKVGYNGDKVDSYPTFGQWKASEAVPTTDGNSYEVLTVPSPVGRNNNNTLGKHTGSGNVELVSGLNASEGSFGYLLTKQWFGANSYTADTATGTLTPTGAAAEEKIIYSHVQSQESKLTLYLLDKNRGNPKKIVLGNTGKSSSVDMLPDGSIVIAAENTKDGKGYFLYYERYSQAQLARLAQ